jgi:hypothetical protein
VEKRDSSNFGDKRGGSRGKQGAGKGYSTTKAGTSNTRTIPQGAASSIQDQLADMPAAAQAPLRRLISGDSPTVALAKLVAADKGGKCYRSCAADEKENTCALNLQRLHGI